MRQIYFFLAAVLFLFAAVPSFAKSGDPFISALPSASVSAEADSFDFIANPVFADMYGSVLGYRFLSYSKENHLTHQAMLGLGGFALGFTRLNVLDQTAGADAPSASYWTIGKGFFINDVFGFGFNYSFTSNAHNFDNYSSWTFGTLWRPCSFLSFGYAAQDFRNRDLGTLDIRPNNVYSVSLRPFGDVLTLSFDARQAGFSPIKDFTMSYSAKVKLSNDIMFSLGYEKKYYSFGVYLPLDTSVKTASTTTVNGYGGYVSGAHYAGGGFAFYGKKSLDAASGGRRIVQIDIEGDYPEVPKGFFAVRKHKTFIDISAAIESASRDKSVKGIIINIIDCSMGLAQVEEIRAQLIKCKAKGQKVYALLSSVDNKEYYLATAADVIYLAPNVQFYLPGLAAEVYFYKDGMEKLGVRFDSVRHGSYKSFNEPFTP